MMAMGKRADVVYSVRSAQDTVAVGLGVGHEQSAYPNPVKVRLKTLSVSSESSRQYAEGWTEKRTTRT